MAFRQIFRPCPSLPDRRFAGLSQRGTVQRRSAPYGCGGDNGIFRHFLQDIDDFPTGELAEKCGPAGGMRQFRKFRGDQLQRIIGIRIGHADPVGEDPDLIELLRSWLDGKHPFLHKGDEMS